MILSIYLHELLEGWVDDAPQVRLSGINPDNHSIEAGEAFVAVQGQVGHGLDYARAAVNAGAVAVIHDGLRVLPALDVPAVQINDLGHKLGELASRYYAAPSELMTIAGVTAMAKPRLHTTWPSPGNVYMGMPEWQARQVIVWVTVAQHLVHLEFSRCWPTAQDRGLNTWPWRFHRKP